ncbi:hypothetical protein N7499_007270 [Penicillium canescens]|uniref:Uncharacterized protein n=1 Tax=Penicillium canescens TaxID=5083 RepID=A0AAD6IF41_PENCN|nr:uncharacterized protein N7446_002961 [Penicillium canescens]KAJ5996413.1 hypothetical protein N7522_008073 [Penicillium canescens]KAJ6044767.1 hypothetical protein N7460_006122 [Penicillium canescens]KAJ6056236.1 hypothetical protein N7444_005334 [Penicillium canescens]KAJ6075184.1 hypothetical protein N7446_002961 [Penicillium canescens]KAJ6082396.1 hypothetical protein N7499_007270 [Penicillium canescens]
MASPPDQAGPAPNDTALWHVISTGYTSQYDLSNTVGNAPGSGFTHMSTNTGQEATDADNKEQVRSFINLHGPDPCRLPDGINEGFGIVLQVIASDGNAAATMTPRRSGRLRNKHVAIYKPLKPAAVTHKRPKSSGKKNKSAAPPPSNTEDQPLTIRSELILQPSWLTDELFDASVEELWLVYRELCHEKSVVERHARALGKDITMLREEISRREDAAPVPVHGTKWGF